ncbi:MAG: hypothetical protein ACFFBK_07400, partial [Promethearchaeota archaeon]
MSEEILREVIGLAKKAKWIQIKKFIKYIVQKTLKKEKGYNLTALDVSINGKKKPKVEVLINNKEKIKEIDKISDFNHLALFQATQNSNNVIEVSQNNGTLVILAKYLGPGLNNHQIFDFSVHLNAFDEPFFTIGSGEKINSSEILKLINKKVEPKAKPKKEIKKKVTEQLKDKKVRNIEEFVFEKLTNKKAIWNRDETKTFQNWKAKIKNKYRIESGKITHYKGKPTVSFSKYLESLYKNKEIKKQKSKKKIEKTVPPSKKVSKKFSEKLVFETLTGKNAIWNGTETKNFKDWKQRMHK